ncbi:hypothetical protein PV797_11115 [Clostridiaceae bacterium M8S5]|nr:hypothetical protein PV797_11115 [Clostridiaceae bacterium M8S5]
MLVSPFSAIYSWQGYEYQGHVALLITLQNIKELVLSDSNEIDNMILEVEGAEDFSIKNQNKYLSLHQVKRGAFQLDRDGKFDKFSFVISLLQYDVEKGYYHVLPNKSIPTDFVERTLEHIDKLLADLDKEVKAKGEVKEDDEKNFIMLNKIVHNAKKGSLYDIIYFVCNGQKNKEIVEQKLSNIKDELNDYKQKLIIDNNLKNDDELLEKYIPSFNDSKEVKESSYKIIREILRNQKPEWYMFVDDDYLKFIYGQILLELKNVIENDFINEKSTKKGSQIYFSSIYEIITEDYHSNANSIEYQYFLLWNNIQNMYMQFPKRSSNPCTVDLCDDCCENNACNLYKQIQAISSIKEDDLHSFLYRLILKEPERGKPHNLPADGVINRLFVNLLKEIELLSLEENNLIQAQKEGVFYRLTLDSSGDVEELQEQLVKEQLSASTDKLLIYESDVLITDQLDKENFIYDSINTTVIDENQYEELKNITSDSIDKLKKNYSKPKIMRLINRSIAKEELNK